MDGKESYQITPLIEVKISSEKFFVNNVQRMANMLDERLKDILPEDIRNRVGNNKIVINKYR
jgi:hypothetical protein